MLLMCFLSNGGKLPNPFYVRAPVQVHFVGRSGEESAVAGLAFIGSLLVLGGVGLQLVHGLETDFALVVLTLIRAVPIVDSLVPSQSIFGFEALGAAGELALVLSLLVVELDVAVERVDALEALPTVGHFAGIRSFIAM